MTFGLIYWVLMLIWLVFELMGHAGFGGVYAGIGSTVLFFILFLLLGWKVFGPPVQP